MTDAFRRTQRRVNALDHIVLPDITEAIRRMEETMDEMERDDLVRSLLIRRKQAVTEASPMAKARDEEKEHAAMGEKKSGRQPVLAPQGSDGPGGGSAARGPASDRPARSPS